MIPVVKSHPYAGPGLSRGLNGRVELGRPASGRLFDQDVLPIGGGRRRDRGEFGMNRRDDNEIDVRGRDGLPPIRRCSDIGLTGG